MHKAHRLPILGLTLMLSSTALADYRAHLLNVTNYETGQTREIISTLDHLQYPGYYPLAPGERVELASSWRCPGRTSHRPICPNPANAPLDQGR